MKLTPRFFPALSCGLSVFYVSMFLCSPSSVLRAHIPKYAQDFPALSKCQSVHRLHPFYKEILKYRFLGFTQETLLEVSGWDPGKVSKATLWVILMTASLSSSAVGGRSPDFLCVAVPQGTVQ